MDKKILTKENAGSKGTGFEGSTQSNSYAALPRSSNANLGIDADTAMGVANAVSSGNYGGQLNVGAKETKSSNKGVGLDADTVAVGTVGARENMGGYGPADDRGEFGTSALSGGHKEGSTAESLGSGARAKGTGSSETGTPGRSGSMLFAAKGLSQTSSGPSFKAQPREAATKSMADAESGIQKKATW